MRGLKLLAALAVLATGVSVATPAQAAPVAPSATRTFSTLIDAPAGWERESGCDQTEKKGPKRLRKLLLATYGLIPSNILRPCSRSDSGHEEGRALDWMVNARVPEQKEMAEAFLGWLQAADEFGNPSAMARRLGIQYVIWNNQMWRTWDGQWSAYSDCAKKKMRSRAYDNTCHRNHVHVSFSWDGALGRTSFYTGFVACPAAEYDVWAEPVVPAGVPAAITPVGVLKTRTGLGLVHGTCRAHAGMRLDVPVTGVGEVPLIGADSVTINVLVKNADAPTELRVWQAGTEAPFDAQVLADKGVPGSVSVTVPVGPEGLVSFELTGGMAHVVATVTGYSLAPVVVPPVLPGVPVEPPPLVPAA